MEKIDGREILKKLNDNLDVNHKNPEEPKEGDLCEWEVTGSNDKIYFCFSNGEWWSGGEKANKEKQKELTKKYKTQSLKQNKIFAKIY